MLPVAAQICSESERAAGKAFGSAGGKLVMIGGPEAEAAALREDVK